MTNERAQTELEEKTVKAYILRWPGEWEMTLMIGRLQLRLGNMQQALWWHRGGNVFVTLFNVGRRIRATQ
jgi:hypothetical protein